MPNLDRGRPALRVAAAAAAFCLVFVVLAARADAYLYWANIPTASIISRGTGSIARANLDGSGVDQGFIPDAVGGPPLGGFAIAVDAEHIYWTDPDAETIARADLDGSDVDRSFIAGAAFLGYAPEGVAVDAEHIYWTNPDMGTIGRADLDGSHIDQAFITGAGFAAGVAVDAGHLYWADGGRIRRANLDGGGAEQSFVTVEGCVPTATAVAVNATHIYWANEGLNCGYDLYGSVGRADLDGGAVEQDIAAASHPRGIAVNAGHVYWTNSGALARANLDGSASDLLFGSITGPHEAADFVLDGVAVDALTDTDPPQTKITKGAPNKLGRSKVKFRFTSSEPDSTFECKLDRKPNKPCTSPRKVKRLDEGKHRFKVIATDAAGNTDPSAAKDRFEVVD